MEYYKELAKQKKLNGQGGRNGIVSRLGRGAVEDPDSDEPCRKNAGIVYHEHVPGTDIVRYIAENAMLDRARGAVDHHETGAVPRFGAVLGDQAFGTIAKGAEQNKKMAPAKYIAEAMKIYMAARTGGQMPGTTMAESTANDIWTAAQEENRQATKDRQAAGQLKVEAGKGTASFDGAEYGTDAWKKKVKGLSKSIRDQMGAVAEYAKRIGLHVDFINDPENEAIFGSEDRSTGRITINVAGKEANYTTGGKTVIGGNQKRNLFTRLGDREFLFRETTGHTVLSIPEPDPVCLP